MTNPLTQEPKLDAEGKQIVDADGITVTITREMTDDETKSYQDHQAYLLSLATEATRIEDIKVSIAAKRISKVWVAFTQEEVDYFSSVGM